MMKFDIQGQPPTEDEVQQERKSLLRAKKALVGWSIMFAILATAAAVGYFATFGIDQAPMLEMASLFEKKGKHLLVWAFLFLFGLAITLDDKWQCAAFLASSTIMVTVANLTAFNIVYFFWPSPSFIEFYFMFLGPLATAAIATLVTTNLDSGYDKAENALSGLAPIPREAQICVELLSACKTCLDCDRYNTAVASQGRHVVKAEAEALVKWAGEAEDRAQKEARRQERCQACSELRSGASLFEA